MSELEEKDRICLVAAILHSGSLAAALPVSFRDSAEAAYDLCLEVEKIIAVPWFERGGPIVPSDKFKRPVNATT